MADISGIFGSTVNVLGNAVKGASMEQDQIANNLANVNTPGYRRSTTSFREALQASLGAPGDPDQLALQTNDDRQFEIGGPTPAQAFDPQAHADDTLQMRVDRATSISIKSPG